MMNGLYELIDTDFFKKLYPTATNVARQHLTDLYISIVKNQNSKIIIGNSDIFANANRRKLKLIQCYCPFCGSINIVPFRHKMQNIQDLKYCSRCGKRSISITHQEELLKFIRMHLLTKELEAHVDKKVFLNDFYQIQISTLASITECYLRDVFISLYCMKHYSPWDEIKENIAVEVKNDFLNLGKASVYFKKYFNIDIKNLVGKDNFQAFEEISALRNLIIHNNGFVDRAFIKNPISSRIGTYKIGELIFIEESTIVKYYEHVKDTFIILSHEFEKINLSYRYRNLSMHYIFSNDFKIIG